MWPWLNGTCSRTNTIYGLTRDALPTLHIVSIFRTVRTSNEASQPSMASTTARAVRPDNTFRLSWPANTPCIVTTVISPALYTTMLIVLLSASATVIFSRTPLMWGPPSLWKIVTAILTVFSPSQGPFILRQTMTTVVPYAKTSLRWSSDLSCRVLCPKVYLWWQCWTSFCYVYYI